VNQSLTYELDAIMPAAVATGLFSQLFTAQSLSDDLGGTGATTGAYTNVPGLVNIPCMPPPPSEARVQATEVKALAEITGAELHHVLLDKWYSALDLGWRDGWRCMIGANDGNGNMINGWAYDIMGVESDSQTKMTRLEIKLVTV
jgi:hypothetical protein